MRRWKIIENRVLEVTFTAYKQHRRQNTLLHWQLIENDVSPGFSKDAPVSLPRT